MAAPQPSAAATLASPGGLAAGPDPNPEAHSVSFLLPESISLAPPANPSDVPYSLSTLISSSRPTQSFPSTAEASSTSTDAIDPANTALASGMIDGFDGQLSKGSIAAATFGAMSAVAAIVVIVYFVMLRRKVVRRSSIDNSSYQPRMQIGRSGSQVSEMTLGNNAAMRPPEYFAHISNNAGIDRITRPIRAQTAADRLSWSSTMTPTSTLVPSIRSNREGNTRDDDSEFSEATTANARIGGTRLSLMPRMPAGLVRLNNWLQENRRRSATVNNS